MSYNTIYNCFDNVGAPKISTEPVVINQKKIPNLSKIHVEYIKTMSDKEYNAYEIARDMLETSFDLERSIGYKKWLSNK